MLCCCLDMETQMLRLCPAGTVCSASVCTMQVFMHAHIHRKGAQVSTLTLNTERLMQVTHVTAGHRVLWLHQQHEKHIKRALKISVLRLVFFEEGDGGWESLCACVCVHVCVHWFKCSLFKYRWNHIQILIYDIKMKMSPCFAKFKHAGARHKANALIRPIRKDWTDSSRLISHL